MFLSDFKDRFLKLSGSVLFLILLSFTMHAGKKQDTMLGPTGMYGKTTREGILITKIEKGSPADGKIKKGDVVIGIGDTKFRKKPLRVWAKAIDEAESDAAGGHMTLMLKNKKTITIKLKVLGSYSPTAPYNCAKSDEIISRAADALVKSGKFNSPGLKTELLALMATGEKKYIDVAGKVIREDKHFKVDPEKVESTLKGDTDMGYVGWYWGYNLIIMGEYYLLTGDKSVLPAMRTFALGLARGQDAVGLWGHRMATEKRNGRLAGYAQMNQPSISDFMGMLFARKCGIKDPVLDKGIKRSYAYFKDHVDKGGFPYGVHGPQPNKYNNNGMSGSAAICMELQGNSHGASFFSQLAATSYDNLEQGHASSFFNPLWTPLGANISGPEVTQQFFKKSLWFFNMRRGWNGDFPGSDGAGSDAATALLMYCIPRKALIITGRDADKSLWFKGEDATKIIMRSKIDFQSMDTDKILTYFNDKIPQVRYFAKAALQKKKNEGIVPKLLKLIKNGTYLEKRTAISYFGKGCPKEKINPEITEILGNILRDKDEDIRSRITAATALAYGNHGDKAKKYYNDILELSLEKKPKDDPFNLTDKKIAYAASRLYRNPFKTDMKINKDLIYKVALKFMDNKLQNVRGCGENMLVGMPLCDFHIVADKLTHVLDNNDPGYYTYHNLGTTAKPGVAVLADLEIKEGIDYLEDIIFNQHGKWGFKMRMLMQTLPLYGGNAKPYISKFESHPSIAKKGDRFYKPWKKVVKEIEEDKNPKKLITLKEAKEAKNQK